MFTKEPPARQPRDCAFLAGLCDDVEEVADLVRSFIGKKPSPTPSRTAEGIRLLERVRCEMLDYLDGVEDDREEAIRRCGRMNSLIS